MVVSEKMYAPAELAATKAKVLMLFPPPAAACTPRAANAAHREAIGSSEAHRKSVMNLLAFVDTTESYYLPFSDGEAFSTKVHSMLPG